MSFCNLPRFSPRRFLLLLALAGLLPCFANATGKLQQIGVLSSLVAGDYDGNSGMMDVLQRPQAFGLGTFDKLDGEMVVIDGVIYQVSSNGKVGKPHTDSPIPFACVSVMENKPDVQEDLGEIATMSDFEKLVMSRLQSLNYPALIVVNGDFKSLSVRSVPAQKKPYLPLADTLSDQQVKFNLGSQKGTLVGFYCPPYMAGLNAPGIHLHFLNDAHEAGGHVLDFALEHGILRIQTLTGVQVILPGVDSSFAVSDIATEADVEKVEGE